MTKTFVATVVLQLVAEHRVGLDDPVERHLPGVVPNGGQITVRQLLGHTSGIFNYTEDASFAFEESAGTLQQWLATGRWRSYQPRSWSRWRRPTRRTSIRGRAGTTPTPTTSSRGC
ncbi:serine hydrolase domain-containing protein [Kitasatospora aburaviensis]